MEGARLYLKVVAKLGNAYENLTDICFECIKGSCKRPEVWKHKTVLESLQIGQKTLVEATSSAAVKAPGLKIQGRIKVMLQNSMIRVPVERPWNH